MKLTFKPTLTEENIFNWQMLFSELKSNEKLYYDLGLKCRLYNNYGITCYGKHSINCFLAMVSAYGVDIYV